jgi:hypothetical protein
MSSDWMEKKSCARMFWLRAAAKMSAKIAEARDVAEAWRCRRGSNEHLHNG